MSFRAPNNNSATEVGLTAGLLSTTVHCATDAGLTVGLLRTTEQQMLD